MLNQMGKTDWAKSAELLFKDLLAIAYDQRFELNQPVNGDTFDLEGDDGQLVQVTSRTDAEKIKKTLATYSKKGYAGPIYFALLANKPTYQSKTFETCGVQKFDQKKQILGVAELVILLTGKGLQALASAVQSAKKHLEERDNRAEKVNASLLKDITEFVAELESSCTEIERSLSARHCGPGRDENLSNAAQATLELIRTFQDFAVSCHREINSRVGERHESLRLTSKSSSSIIRPAWLGSKASQSGSKRRPNWVCSSRS